MLLIHLSNYQIITSKIDLNFSNYCNMQIGQKSVYTSNTILISS